MKLSDRLQDAMNNQPKTEQRLIPTDLLIETINYLRAFEGCRAKIDCLTRGEIT